MLVLSRRRGERIVIQTPEGDVWLTIHTLDKYRVRIGIDAPRDIVIERQERLPESNPQPPAA